MKEVYFTAWPFSKLQVLHWPVARAIRIRSEDFVIRHSHTVNNVTYHEYRVLYRWVRSTSVNSAKVSADVALMIEDLPLNLSIRNQDVYLYNVSEGKKVETLVPGNRYQYRAKIYNNGERRYKGQAGVTFTPGGILKTPANVSLGGEHRFYVDLKNNETSKEFTSQQFNFSGPDSGQGYAEAQITSLVNGTIGGKGSVINDAVPAPVQPNKTPPTPNPLTWKTEPYLSGDVIEMEADEAKASSGSVDYEFSWSNANGDIYGEATQSDRSFSYSVIESGTYDFKVRAVDSAGNKTGFSAVKSVTVNLDIKDTTPPGPVVWSSYPGAVNSSSISMEAKDVGESGAQYYFRGRTGSSWTWTQNWSTSRNWSHTGLSPDTTYYYQFKVRDAAGNESAWSTEQSATTYSVLPDSVTISGSALYRDRSGSYVKVPGVTILAVDVDNRTEYKAVTDQNGAYALQISYNKEVRIRVLKTPGDYYMDYSEYTRYASVSNVNGPDFFCYPSSWTRIDGWVKTTNGTSVSGIWIDAKEDNTGGYNSTDISLSIEGWKKGYYSLAVPPDWSGNISPRTDSFHYFPSGIHINSGTVWPRCNFTQSSAAPAKPVATISGIIYNTKPDRWNDRVFGATLSFSNNGGIWTTDDSGVYQAQVPRGWSGSVTVQVPGVDGVVTPASRSYTQVLYDQMGENYDFEPQSITVSGVLTGAGAGIAVKYRSVDDDWDDWKQTQTLADGSYVFSVPYRWSGRIQPQGNGSAEPNDVRLWSLTAHQVQNFTWFAAISATPYFSSAAGAGSDRIQLVCVLNNISATHGRIQWRTGWQEWSSSRQWEFAASAAGSQMHTGLAPKTTYFYRLQAFNQYDASAWSAVSSVQTWEPAPPAPVVSAAPLDHRSLRVAWTYPDNNLERFEVHYRPSGGAWRTLDRPRESRLIDLSGLQADTVYEIEVYAHTQNQKTGSVRKSARTQRTPMLHVSPEAHSRLTVTQGPGHRPTVAVTVKNAGDGVLNWGASSQQGSMVFSPATGSLSAQQAITVSVQCNTDSLTEGDTDFYARFSADVDGLTQTKDVQIPIRIRNIAPKAQNVHILPSAPLSGTTLNGHYTYYDQDGHPEGNSARQWYRNGELVRTGSSQVPGSLVTKGDRWAFEVVVHDCFKKGETVRTQPVVIQNAPPRITGHNIIINQGSNYSVNLRESSSDPDDPVESLTYSVSGTPPAWLGAAVSGHTFSLNPAAASWGAATVRVRVSDGDKHAEADFPVDVDARPWLINSPPPAYSVNEDETLRIDLWQFFADDKTPTAQLSFSTADDRPQLFASVSQNRYLLISGEPNWPSTDAGPQATPVAITAQDNRAQTVTWTPTITFHPVNDPPQWTGYIEDLTMTDGDANPLAIISAGGHSLRAIVTDIDTSLSAVPDAHLFSTATSDAGLTATLEGDKVRLSPAGGWWKSAVVTVTVNDRETRAQPHNQTAGTTFRVTVADDDTDPPEFGAFQTTMADPGAQSPTVQDGIIRVQENQPFHIACTIIDSQSGVYDDNTGGGPGEQGVYLVWDDDGDLGNGHKGLIQLSRVHGDLFRTDAPIPGLDGTVGRNFVYEIFAWDNDFDRGYAGDRAMGRTGVRRDIVINDLPEVSPATPGTEQHITVPLAFSLADANQDPIDLSVEYIDPRTGQWLPADLVSGYRNLLVYTNRTVTWESARKDAEGNWVGNLPGLDLGDPNSAWPDPVRLRFRAFDGHHYGPYSEIAFHLDNNLLPGASLQPVASEYAAQGWEKLPSFDLLLSDVEKDTAWLRVEHRWNPEGSWRPSTVSLNSGTWRASVISNITAAVYDMKRLAIRWDAVADAVRDGVVPNHPADLEGVAIRFTPGDFDSTQTGQTIQSAPFAIDLFPAARIVHQGEPVVDNSHASFRILTQTYRIDPGYVRHESAGQVWYSGVAGRTLGSGPHAPTGPGLTLRYAFRYAGNPGIHAIEPLSGLLSGLNLPSKTYAQYQNQDITVAWNFSYDDSELPQLNLPGVSLLIAADNDEPGAWSATDPATLNNNFSPEVTALAVASDGNRLLPDGAYRGDLTMDAVLADRESDPISLRFAYSLDGTTWHPATVAEAARQRDLPPGPHRFVWRARSDLPQAAHAAVRFRVAADDSSPGVWRELAAPIALDNRNLTPAAELLAMAPVSTGPGAPYQIRLAIEDQNDDACRIAHFAFTVNGGLDWTAVPVETLAGNVPIRNGILTAFWDSDGVLDALPPDAEVVFRLAVDDGTPFVSEAHPVAHPARALAWDGVNLWSFDFAADRGYRHNLAAAGWPSLDPAGHALPYNYPEGLDISGRNGSPWTLLPEPANNRSLLVNFNWNGTAFGSPQFRMSSGTIGAGIALGSGTDAFATLPLSREFALLDTATGAATRFGRLETAAETALARRAAEDEKDGLWTLQRGSGLLRQYAQNTNTLAWSCVRLLDSGRADLWSIEWIGDQLWAIDADSNELIRSDEVSASRFVTSAPLAPPSAAVQDAPAITALAVASTAPFTTDDLTLTVTAFDPAGASLSTHIRWTRNGAHVAAYDDLAVIPAADTAAGDRWQAQVWVDNGSRLSLEARTPAITVQNSAPQIGSLSALPALAYTEDTLAVSGQPVDPDGGPVALSYAWKLDGEPFGWERDSLPGWATLPGDHWQVTVTAEDQAGALSEFMFNWTIANRAPVITPIPPQVVQEAEWLWFRVEAQDPEGHAITYQTQVQSGDLPGLVMWHAAGQTFFWYPNYEAAGEYSLTFTATDALGAVATQTVAVTVLDTARPPYIHAANDIIAYEGDTIDLLAGQLGGAFDLASGTLPLAELRALGVQFYVRGVSSTDYTDLQDSFLGNLCSSVQSVDSNTVFETTFEDSGSYELELFAVDPSGSTSTPRTIHLYIHNVNRPPYIIAPETVAASEGQTVTFQVVIGDPDNENSVSNDDNALFFHWDGPFGSTMTPAGENTWTFEWTPGPRTAGEYPLGLFVADDAEPPLTAGQVVVISVAHDPSLDTDGDGLLDAWEFRHFGNLDRDGTGDADGDGFTDQEEHDAGSDPSSARSIPPAATRTYALSNGWNTVVLDVTADDMSVSNLFADVAVNLAQVRGWDAEAQQWWRWNLEKPFLSTVDGAHEVQTRQALNIQLTNSCLWTVHGSTSHAVVNLRPGWNYVGLPGFIERTVPVDLMELGGSCEVISDMQDDYDFVNGSGGLTNVVPRKAIWMKMNQNHEWE